MDFVGSDQNKRWPLKIKRAILLFIKDAINAWSAINCRFLLKIVIWNDTSKGFFFISSMFFLIVRSDSCHDKVQKCTINYKGLIFNRIWLFVSIRFARGTWGFKKKKYSELIYTRTRSIWKYDGEMNEGDCFVSSINDVPKFKSLFEK